jgi:hypothetical protein
VRGQRHADDGRDAGGCPAQRLIAGLVTSAAQGNERQRPPRRERGQAQQRVAARLGTCQPDAISGTTALTSMLAPSPRQPDANGGAPRGGSAGAGGVRSAGRLRQGDWRRLRSAGSTWQYYIISDASDQMYYQS